MTQLQMQQLLQQKQQQINQIAAVVDSKERAMRIRESQIRQNQLNLSGPRGMHGMRGMGDPAVDNPPSNLIQNITSAVGGTLTPGNIGDINSVIWPFYFPTEIPDTPLAVNDTFQTGFSITQEAAFIFMSFVKSVYLVEGEGVHQSWTYLDPDQSNPSAPGLVFTLRDGSSSRQFFNTPMAMDNYGNPRFPTMMPRPVMLLPNQVMQVAFVNTHPTNVYVPIITAFGYRLRIDQAQKLLSLVYA